MLNTFKLFKIMVLGIIFLTPLYSANIKHKTYKSHKSHKTHKIIKYSKKYLGVKYRYGGNSFKGIDCSAFTQKILKKVGKKLPRTARMQFKRGKFISKKHAKKSDLIFFSDSKRRIGHVGIIIDPKRKLMIHASSGAGKVTITSYNKPYYRRHFKGIKRIL